MGPLEDTICAIATPRGEGGVGIVRISGPRSLDYASRVVTLRSGRSLKDIRSHTLCLGDLSFSSDQKNASGNGKDVIPLDQIMVTVMRAPKSYTGEHVVEVHCHGGQLILSTLCEAVIREGARLAEPGEFTKRAFLNGRMDLVQAEAVLDTIRATTTASLKVAQEQLRGGLSKKIERLRAELIRVLAHLEAGMDFAEEDISFIGRDELNHSLQLVSEEITELVNTAEEGRLLREGVITAIVGRPNVGKSSLLNLLLDRDRAIVSNIPGTTRDVLEETLNIQGVPIRLIDTAGLRKTADSLEAEGIRRTTDAITQADLVVIVLDGSQNLTSEDVEILNNNCSEKTLVVINKVDLQNVLEGSDVSAKAEMKVNSEIDTTADPLRIIKISAKTGQGLDKLREEIRNTIPGLSLESNHSLLITRLRHKTALLRAQEAVSNSLNPENQPLSGECLALDLRLALDALGEIIGVVSTDDILDRIFQEFCIGK